MKIKIEGTKGVIVFDTTFELHTSIVERQKKILRVLADYPGKYYFCGTKVFACAKSRKTSITYWSNTNALKRNSKLRVMDEADREMLEEDFSNIIEAFEELIAFSIDEVIEELDETLKVANVCG